MAGLALVLSACAGPTPPGEGVPTKVVAAFYPLAFAAEGLGRTGVEVTGLTPPGVEPHDLELTTDDLVKIADADVVLLLGGGFQPAVEDAVATEARGTVVDVGEGLATIAGDPHVWLDPERYARIVARVRSALEDAGVDTSASAPAFVARIDDLARRFEEGLAGCAGRLLITNHAAFGYLAEAYGLEQDAIAGLSPEAEPDPAHMAALVDEIRASGVRTVFTETLVPPDVADTLAAEAGVEVRVLDPLEGLARDRIDAGADYVSVMGENLLALREGLDC